MKISNELRKVIVDSFEKRASDIRTNYNKARNENYDSFIEQIKTDADYIMACKLIEQLREKYDAIAIKSDYVAPSTTSYSQFKIIEPNTGYYMIGGKNDDNCTKEIKQLDSEKTKLLIKLSYESDTDRLMDVLKEFGVTI